MLISMRLTQERRPSIRYWAVYPSERDFKRIEVSPNWRGTGQRNGTPIALKEKARPQGPGCATPETRT